MQGLSENTQAVLLLCGVFGGDVLQLSTGEYNKLAMGLKDLQLQPADLLHGSANATRHRTTGGTATQQLSHHTTPVKTLPHGKTLGKTLVKI